MAIVSMVASLTFGVTWSRPDINAPVDCCGVPMNSIGGLSMTMLSVTGLVCINGDEGSRAFLSLDKDRSLSFLSFLSPPGFLLRPGRVGRLIWSMVGKLGRRKSVTEELAEELGEDLR